MKTITLVLDSSQGVGGPASFSVKLNDFVRGCVFSQLRQVILVGALPTSDYIYVRSSKLGSNVVSGEGFGAFDVVPYVKKVPFVYERYSAVPRLSEFECGRLLDTIDISFVNADNTPVLFTYPSVAISNERLFVLHATTNMDDGTTSTQDFACSLPVGTYAPDELATLIQASLNKQAPPNFNFSSSTASGKLEVVMNWDTSEKLGGMVLPLGTELFDVAFEASYDIAAADTSHTFPVLSQGDDHTKKGFASMIGSALAPFGKTIGGTFLCSLTPTNSLNVELDWVAPSGVFVGDTAVGTLVVRSSFSNIGPVVVSVPVVLPRSGWMSVDEAAADFGKALGPAGSALASAYLDDTGTTRFEVAASGNSLNVRLSLFMENFFKYVAFPETPLFTASNVALSMSDGTQIDLPSADGTMLAGKYDRTKILPALYHAFYPLSRTMLDNGFTKANVRTELLTSGSAKVSLDWVSSMYADGIELPDLSFVFRLQVWSTFGAQELATAPALPGEYDVLINIRAGKYTQGEVFQVIQSFITAPNNGLPIAMACALDHGRLVVNSAEPVRYFRSVGGSNAWVVGPGRCYFVGIEFIGTGLDLLGLTTPLRSSIPTYITDGGWNSGPRFYETPSISFGLCPSIPPTLTDMTAVLKTPSGDIPATSTIFTNSGFQGTLEWIVPLPVPFPDYTGSLGLFDFGVEGWAARRATITEFLPGQYHFDWVVEVPMPQLKNVLTSITFDPASTFSAGLGLRDSPFLPEENGNRYSWQFPGPFEFPEVSSVSATASNITRDFGSFPGVVKGKLFSFNDYHNQFAWSFFSLSKAIVVVELTTT